GGVGPWTIHSRSATSKARWAWINGLLLERSWQLFGKAGSTVGGCWSGLPPPCCVPESWEIRTSCGIETSFVPKESGVFSDISACHHSVSVFVWMILGHVCVPRQRSSSPPKTPDSLSKITFHVCGDSAPAYCASVCCVPDSRLGSAKPL